MNRRTPVFALLLCCSSLTSLEWTVLPVTVLGSNMDAVSDTNGVLHIVAKEYVAIHPDGSVLRRERPDAVDMDLAQTNLGFSPSIAVGPDGSVHTLTRNGGDMRAGHVLNYRKRSPQGAWSAPLQVGVPEPRNYTPGITVLDNGRVFAVHGSLLDQDNVWGPLVLYEIAGAKVQEIGRLNSWWRSDNECRLRSVGNELRLVSGRNDANGTTRIGRSVGGADLLNDLKASVQIHTGGGGRRGFPSVALSADGSTHLVYGANDDQSVHHARYTPQFTLAPKADAELFRQLGSWHLSVGLSEVAVSRDGSAVLVIAVHTDDSKQASVCSIEWRLSRDGGATWTPAATIPDAITGGGEGRRRPRVAWQDGAFTLAHHRKGDEIRLLRLQVGDTPDNLDLPPGAPTGLQVLID